MSSPPRGNPLSFSFFWVLIVGLGLGFNPPLLSQERSYRWGILYTGLMRGRVESCGHCPGSTVGGLARRQTALQSLDSTIHWVGLDAGGFLDLDPEGGKTRSLCAFEILAKQGHRVFGVTARDLFYGIDFLQNAFLRFQLRAVSANIVAAPQTEPLFPPWDTLIVDGLTLAVTSLSLPPTYSGDSPGWKVEAPEKVISRLIDLSPHSAQVRILLTDADEATLREWGDAIECFHLVISSSRYIYTQTPFTIGKTWVVKPQMEGRALDGMILTWERGRLQILQHFSVPLGSHWPPDRDTERRLSRCFERRP